MEKAILKTLIYADIFDYPMKAWEIHKWLINKKTSLSEIDKSLKKLLKNKKILVYRGYYFLPKRLKLVSRRIGVTKQSERYLFQVKLMGKLFKLVPWIKLVGVSGSLAMKNAGKKDDIDLFVVTDNNRIWISRILILGILILLGKRRKATDTKRQAIGKVCINLLLEEQDLGQEERNIYIAHELLQMQVLWQRYGVYSRYLEDNLWALNFLPNWIGSINVKSEVRSQKSEVRKNNLSFISYLEYLTKWAQLRYMTAPKGLEKITNTALYFHPENYQDKVLREYKRRIKKIED